MKTTKTSYVPPAISITRVHLEEGIAIASPVNGVGLEGWDDGGEITPDTGDIMWGGTL